MRSIVGSIVGALLLAADGSAQPRPPQGDTDLRFWLENMVVHHGFSGDEVSAATGLDSATQRRDLERLGITPGAGGATRGGVLRVLPYPGGRHPRLGFLDGAISPQRETKLSVFTPWTPAGYVVVDVPEAIWTDLGLTYLAHTHIPTIWDAQETRLAAGEWSLREDGSWASGRTLPNGISERCA